MVKANISVGGKILLIVLTIVIYTVVLVGGIVGIGFYAYKNVKVKDIAGLVGAENWISQDYEGTISDLIGDVSALLSDGSVSINDLAEISPAITEKLDAVIGNVEEIGLFSIDRETLYATPLNEISASVSDMLIVTATLNGMSETFGFDLPDIPLISGSQETPVWFYTQANAQNEDGTFTEIAKEFSAAGETFSYYTREEVYRSTYTDGGEEQNVVSSVQKTKYTLADVTVQNGFLTLNGSSLYLGEYTEDGGAVSYAFTRMTPNNDAVLSSDDNGNYAFALGENESVYVISGPAAGVAGSAEDGSFAYERAPGLTEAGTAYVYEIALPYRYVPLYADVNGQYVPATVTDENGNYVIDTENGGYLIDGDYAGMTLYYLDYAYGEAMDYEQAAEAAKTQAVFVRSNGVAELPVTKALDTLSAILNMNELTLADFESYFGVQLSGNAALERVLYVPLGRFADALNEEMQNIRISDVLTLDENSPYALLRLAYGDDFYFDESGNVVTDTYNTIGTLTGSMDALTISDFVDIEEPDESGQGGSAKLLIAIKDWTLGDLSNGDKLNSRSLGDLLDIQEPDENGEGGSAKILLALKDVAIGNISEEINKITLGEILNLSDADTLLGALSESTLQTLADDIADLSVQTLFSDNMYEQNLAGTLAGIDELISVYGEENLYLKGNGGYIPYTDYTQEELAELTDATPVYSPYTIVTDDMTSDYTGVPLYYLDREGETPQMTLATGVTGWTLPAQDALPDGVTSDTKFYVYDGGKYAQAQADGGVYGTDTLWYLDKGAEMMKSISLVPAEYGLLPENADKTVFTKLELAVKDGSGHYTVGNLFAYSAEKGRWEQIATTAVKDGEGNVTYTVDEAYASAKLYTYGKVTGTWKYLMLKDGEEQACTLQNVGSLVTNVSANIRTATIKDLYEDGLININKPDDYPTMDDMFDVTFPGNEKTFGEMTISDFISAVFSLLASQQP